VLQCVEEWCGVNGGMLQSVAACCNALQCVAVCCSVLQCVAVHNSVLQCVHCSVLLKCIAIQVLLPFL